MFLAYLAKAKKKFRFQLVNFCVMGNHIHLLLQPGRHENLSAIMRWLLGGFSRAYNKSRGVKGHFWGERFYSRVLDGLRQIAVAFDYIDRNPAKAGLVASVRDWIYGGQGRITIGDQRILDPLPDWLRLVFPGRDRCLAL